MRHQPQMTEPGDDSRDGQMPRLAGFEMEGNMERVWLWVE